MKKTRKQQMAAQRVTEWRRRTKGRLLEGFGSKCGICGYSKCNQALEFHHVDPNEKDFSFNGRMRKWEVYVTEMQKCVLLCANCHREVHWNQLEIPETIQRFDEQLIHYVKYQKSDWKTDSESNRG